jgi:hypothetical protein
MLYDLSLSQFTVSCKASITATNQCCMLSNGMPNMIQVAEISLVIYCGFVKDNIRGVAHYLSALVSN